MKTNYLFAAAAGLLLLGMPVAGFSQMAQLNDWSVLEGLVSDEKLIVELNKGKTVKGAFAWTGYNSLTVSKGNKKLTEIPRKNIHRVYIDLGKSVGRSVLKGMTIGAQIGGGVPQIVGKDCGVLPSPNYGLCFHQSDTEFSLLSVAFSIPGAASGAVVGLLRHNRLLIYEK